MFYPFGLERIYVPLQESHSSDLDGKQKKLHTAVG